MPFKKLFVVYIIFILLLLTLPLNGTNTILNNTWIVEIRLDYLLHAILFLPFLILCIKAWLINIIIALFFGILFAAISEGLQYLLPYRAFNINDLLANILGIFLGVAIAVIAQKWVIKTSA